MTKENQVICEDVSNEFVHDRSTIDIILVAFEVIHYMRSKIVGTTDEIALKLDITKTYNRVN